MRRIRPFSFLFIAAATVLSMPVMAGGIAVPMDQVRMVTFDKPVSTVYLGNPAVADVTVIDSKRVFVLGKAYGSTNLIALDAAGNQIAEKALTVYGGNGGTVTLNRGAEQLTYACAATRCEAAPMPGDASQSFSTVMGEVNQHQSMGKQAANETASQ